jgi:hypothetical protein
LRTLQLLFGVRSDSISWPPQSPCTNPWSQKLFANCWIYLVDSGTPSFCYVYIVHISEFTTIVDKCEGSISQITTTTSGTSCSYRISTVHSGNC